ncbi:uncharacterized protein LOC118187972 isoform X2 [Stegodyphus dumicola]|uniref:uncharacterized protein LOC118187972 isoform X2 n=1 Tax=Stegodyphus dumicola TaxID=202533 RepID=UPI0015ACCBAD|nr:uncharacterized protein LOC118187972 isoform X2 [Stegodyphus dumicola]
MYRYFLLWIIPSLTTSCLLLPDDAKPKGLEERALDSEVVLSAYTRAVYRNENDSTSYSANFIVINVLKGKDHVLEAYQQSKPSQLERELNMRIVNVTNFGDPTKCQSHVRAGETYILFLDILANGHLSARYDGVYGPAVVYSKDKELALEAIGSSPWGEWTPCSGSCGGGIQQRKRHCEGSKKCSNEDGQQRTCNMFRCAGNLNVLEAAGVHRSNLRPASRPTAYTLLPSGSWSSKEEEIIFPRTFPWEFSLLVTVRIRPASSPGFLLRVLHSGSLQVGLYISDTLTLLLSDKDDIRVSFVKSLFDNHWHQMAFSVRRDTVSFYLNCEFNGKLPLPGKIRPFGGKPATIIIGSTGTDEREAFQGDIEQITITGSPDAAENQCNATTQPLSTRTRTSASLHSAQNDLPVRGDIIHDADIIIDDEDVLEDLGSGHRGMIPDENYEEKKDSPKLLKRRKEIPLKEEVSINEDDEKNDKDEDDDDSDDIDVDDDYDQKEDREDDSTDEDNEDIEYGTQENDLVDDRKNIQTTKPDYKKDFEYGPPDEDAETDDDQFEGSGAGEEFVLAWSEWSPCSSTCNWGRRTRTSYCLDNGRNLDSCAKLSSRRSETEACFVRLCPTSTTSTTAMRSFLPAMNNTSVSIKAECKVQCMNGGTCKPPYICHCARGYYGSLCQYVKHLCRVNCKNGGICQPPATCICPKGFFGNECQYGCGMPCPQHSTCQQETNCKCPPGYIPPTCTALCKPQCLNGGECVAPNKCRCKSGYVGKSCHKAICLQGCKNGGECVAPNKCACRSGFTGKDCGQPFCDPACQNGGECVKPYFCHCPTGTKGAFCEKLLCKPECQNGGICIGIGKCSCPKGYGGYLCEKAYCPGGCLNGGKCGKTGKCFCPSGYSGLRCEIKKPCKFVEVKEPYKRGYKQKVTTQVKVPCGAWDWKLCTKTKVHYEMVYKTFFRTSYECEGLKKKYPDYQKLKHG